MLYREVKTSDRNPNQSDWYITSIGKRWYLAGHWYEHSDPVAYNECSPKWWLEPLPEISEEGNKLKVILRQAIRELRRYTKGQKSSPATEIVIDKLWHHYQKLLNPEK